MVFCEISNITKKIFIILLLLTISSVLIATEVKAVDEMISAGKVFLTKGEDPTNKISENSLNTASSTIFKILMVIAIGVAVAVAAILGFNFITGSVEGKAKIMESLMPYIAGCIVAFGAFGIWSTVVKTGDSIEDGMAIVDTGIAELEQEGFFEDTSEMADIRCDFEEILREMYLNGEIAGLYRVEGPYVYVSKNNAIQIFEKMAYETPDDDEFANGVAEGYVELIKRLEIEEFSFLGNKDLVLANKDDVLAQIGEKIDKMLDDYESSAAYGDDRLARAIYELYPVDLSVQSKYVITLEIFNEAMDSFGDQRYGNEDPNDIIYYVTMSEYLIEEGLADYEFTNKEIDLAYHEGVG